MKPLLKYSLLATCAFAALPLGTTHALAQASSPSAAPADAKTAPDSVEVIVTAQKRSENVLKVPVTIEVLGGKDLKTVGVNTVSDVQNLVPGVVIGTGTFGTNVAIRGVTSTDETSKGELGVAFNIDGAFIGRGQEEGVAFFDLDRVEVLKGPQGTLYGRSSTGGAINVITKGPDIGDFGGYVNVEYGNYNTTRETAALNVPVNDKLAFRFAVNANDRDGYLTPTDMTVTGSPSAVGGGTYHLSAANEAAKDDQHDRTGRFSMLFKPTNDLTIKAVATVGHVGGVGASGAVDDNLKQGGSAALEVYPDPVPSFVRENFGNLNASLNWKLGDVQLDLVGNRQRFADHSQQTGNGNPCDTGSATGICNFGLDDYRGVFNTTQYEARLSNVNPGFFEYVAGANWYQERVQESDHNYSAPVATYSDVTTWIQGIDPVNTTQHKSYGIFAQGTLHLTEQLSLVAGARYTHDQNTRVGTFATPGNTCQGNYYPTDCIGGPNNGTEVDQKVTWKLGLNYQLTPANLLYASISTGFKGGGFNDFSPTTGTVAPYGPESLTAYELGYKGKLLPGLTVTSAIYDYDYTQDQINSLVLFPTSAGVAGVLYTQLAPVKIYGWDNEAHYQVDKDTGLSAALAYNHTRITRFTAGQFQALLGMYGDFSGEPLNNSPEWTANLAATHKFELGNGAQIRARIASKYSSAYWLTSYASVVNFKQPAFTRTDASLTYATPGDALTVQLFVENLENKVQRTAGPNGYNGAYGGTPTGAINAPSAEADGSDYPLGSLGFGVSTPRFFGVRLGVKY